MFILDQQADVFVDALASDHRGQLLFLSVYGRDTSVQQLLARLHQREDQGGVDQLSLRPGRDQPVALQVLVGDPSRLDKLTGRLPRTGLLGNLLHAWIFDPALLHLDPATGSGWLVEPLDEATLSAARAADAMRLRAWQVVQTLSPVPLLDGWQAPVLAHLADIQALRHPACVGPLSVLRIELPDQFTAWVSEQVRTGVLVDAVDRAAPVAPGRPADPDLTPLHRPA